MNIRKPLLASPARRTLLAGAGAFAAAHGLPALAQATFNPKELPSIPAMDEFLAGRKVQFVRMQLDLPRVADNGNSVPMKLGVLGATAPGAVQSIHLFSEKNPVPRMAVFHFPATTSRFDIESRVRLAGTQRVVAIATLADGTLCAKVAEVLVAIAACLDGS
ncbi:MAG TPA: thiosulfate oxidation carrier protein SoxY [Burkholderiales bacterium]|jgi:sulfur-oxidizing protein SoxY